MERQDRTRYQAPSDKMWRIWTASALAKFIMGMHSYASTDWEVHRNWMAITTNLPVKDWYYEETSIWTLDYPPFFAFFEFLLGLPMSIFYPQMLQISKDGYTSLNAVMYQRLTVIVSEILLFIAILKYTKEYRRDHLEIVCLVFLMPALIFVDHIHFQYNGFLYGIQLLSLVSLRNGKYLMGALYFAAVLNFKHIYLYQAPAYFVYLFSDYCFKSGSFSLFRFSKVGSVVAGVFALSFSMFMGQLGQIIKRLFPFKRDWAPNAWAIYQFLDRVLAKLFVKLELSGVKHVGSLTRGLVGDTEFSIFPVITPIVTLLLTVASQLPILYQLWKNPSHDKFMQSLILCGYGSFLFGWHVHEKAILMILIPLSCIGTLSLCPLLFQPAEFITKSTIGISYAIMAPKLLNSLLYRKKQILEFSKMEEIYCKGLLLVFLVSSWLEFTNETGFTFLPLLLISVYCAVGVFYVWIKLYMVFLTRSC